MSDALNAAVVRLAFAREADAAALATLKNAQAAADLAQAPLRDARLDAQAAHMEAESEVKRLMLAAYSESGDRGGLKSVGAEVKLYDTLAYTEADAMAWAKESGMCLALDKKGFEKVAKATDLPFVTKGEEPRVSIASDLTPFIGNNE